MIRYPKLGKGFLKVRVFTFRHCLLQNEGGKNTSNSPVQPRISKTLPK
jgi:hypothetical protein